MRTKTLLMALAVTAAGVLASNAQTVYSANIVGYVNTPLPLGYSLISVPLAGSSGNALTNTIPNTGQLDGAVLSIFNGTSFTQLTFDSGMPTGFGDASDTVAAPTPIINPGTSFYINNNTGVVLTNVFVGSVAIVSVPGFATNSIIAGNTFKSSVLPLGGGITSSLQFTNNGSLDGTVISVPNIVGGAIHGFVQTVFDSGMSTGFGDASDTVSAPEPQIPVAGGFIFNNNAGLGTINWVQNLNP
jgi:hypothetical protein